MDSLIHNQQTTRKLPYSTFHICPECHKEFSGRRNKIFCSIDCKVKSNNAKAAEMNFRVSNELRMLKRNAKILEELYSIESIPFQVDREEIIIRGFAMNCPTTRLKAENGVEWHLIGEYVFRAENNGNQITIMTCNDLKNI